MPQIENEEQLKEWLETQARQVHAAIAARAALRSLPAVMIEPHDFTQSAEAKTFLLSCLRSALTAAVVSTHRSISTFTEVIFHCLKFADRAQSATKSAASLGESIMEFGALSSADSCSDALKRGQVIESIANSAHAAAHTAAHFAVSTTSASQTTRLAAVGDTDLLPRSNNTGFGTGTFGTGSFGKRPENDRSVLVKTVFRHALWPDTTASSALISSWNAFLSRFDHHPSWSFWCDWYRGMLAGQPLDWELQGRVVLIDEKIWEQGPEAVAEEIERIKGEFAAQRPQEPRFPAYEPNDLRPLIQNRIIATASLQGLAVQISGAIEQYHADTGANALPEAFSPLQDMPALMNAIAQTLGDIRQPEDVSSETEQALRAEIGRLNAKVADLEGKLSALSAEIESLSRSEKGKVFSLLRNTALLGGLISGLWAMSGDELGARSRYEKIVTYTNDIRALLMKEGLPQTQVETSLHPRTRPDKGN